MLSYKQECVCAIQEYMLSVQHANLLWVRGGIFENVTSWRSITGMNWSQNRIHRGDLVNLRTSNGGFRTGYSGLSAISSSTAYPKQHHWQATPTVVPQRAPTYFPCSLHPLILPTAVGRHPITEQRVNSAEPMGVYVGSSDANTETPR